MFKIEKALFKRESNDVQLQKVLKFGKETENYFHFS